MAKVCLQILMFKEETSPLKSTSPFKEKVIQTTLDDFFWKDDS